MNRDKLIDIITEANAFYVTDKDDIGIADRYEMSHKLADHLIANGIGDITAEKCRADRADRAEKASEEAYEEIKKLKEFQLDVSIILGTTRKPMLEEIRELKHRADVAEEALRELIAEMYENDVRPICNQEMLYETRLEQAKARLKEYENGQEIWNSRKKV